MNGSSDAVAIAMERFEIPAGYENFLFCLPGFYVAKSDGSISVKETMSIVYNSFVSGLVASRGEEKKAFDAFAKNKLLQFQGKSNLDDLGVVVNAINERLAAYPESESQKIRADIRKTCEKVAQTSGPLFREKVLPEEHAMLERIFSKI
ncbi:hypothetical protein ACFL1X_00740 [Candidatus Hydrogenedentota bacterium]